MDTVTTIQLEAIKAHLKKILDSVVSIVKMYFQHSYLSTSSIKYNLKLQSNLYFQSRFKI